MRRDQVWDFAVFNEAREWFNELFDANADMILSRQQPLEPETEDTTVPWKVGDTAILSRLIPYDIWTGRTQSRLDKAAAKSQTGAPSRRIQDNINGGLDKNERMPLWNNPRAGQKSEGDPLQNGESFFSYGN
jgi:hypothetical protein